MLQSKEERLPEEVKTVIRLEDICYYKLFRGKPDPEYDARCERCNGYPNEGCTKYVTREHIDTFHKKYDIANHDQPREDIQDVIGRLESFEEGGGGIE